MRIALPLVWAASLVSMEMVVMAAALYYAASGTLTIGVTSRLVVVGVVTLASSHLRFHPEWGRPARRRSPAR